MDKRIRNVWWGVLGVLLVIAAIKFFLPVKSPVAITQSAVNREIVVYVTGAVNQPGLLRLSLDARLDDVLKIAGLSPDADLDALNPAQRLKDGQKIIIPFKSLPSGVNPSDVGVLENIQANQNLQASNISGVGGSRININRAGLGELDKIPGVGPVLAQRIIDYREKNGLFSDPEEIQNVQGIGPKTYEKMAEYISVWP